MVFNPRTPTDAGFIIERGAERFEACVAAIENADPLTPFGAIVRQTPFMTTILTRNGKQCERRLR